MSQGFDFDFDVDISDNGALSLVAQFVLNVQGVNPAKALQGAIVSLNSTLQSVGSDFEGVVSSFEDGFSEASKFLEQIATSEALTLELDALIDISVGLELSTSSFAISSWLRNLSSSLLVHVEKSFEIPVGSFDVEVSPAITLQLSAENTAVPFNPFNESFKLGREYFDFGGSFDSRVVVKVEGVPAAVTFEAVLPDITNASSLDFDVFVDIDLYPIREGMCSRDANSLGSILLTNTLLSFFSHCWSLGQH